MDFYVSTQPEHALVFSYCIKRNLAQARQLFSDGITDLPDIRTHDMVRHNTPTDTSLAHLVIETLLLHAEQGEAIAPVDTDEDITAQVDRLQRIHEPVFDEFLQTLGVAAMVAPPSAAIMLEGVSRQVLPRLSLNANNMLMERAAFAARQPESDPTARAICQTLATIVGQHIATAHFTADEKAQAMASLVERARRPHPRASAPVIPQRAPR